MTALLNDQGEPIHRRHVAEAKALLTAIRERRKNNTNHPDQPRTDGPITTHLHPQPPPTPEDD